jgi:glutathione S-transferase
MDPTSQSLILHQYDKSPFSEKIRVIFGMKNLAWHACDQPVIMPKPELVALTGGYRRIPVLQIGADLYFDTVLIIDELERRFPTPSIYAGIGPGMAQALAGWTDQTVFWFVVTALFGGDIPPDPAFMADRSALIGRPFDPEAMKAAAPGALRQLAACFDLAERQLADGRAFLFGAHPSAADASLYHNVAFLRWGQGRAAKTLDDFPHLLEWEARIRAIGHGQREKDLSRDDAMTIAHASVAAPPHATSSRPDLSAGTRVIVRYNDANTPPLHATLIAATQQDFVVRPHDPPQNTLHLHMPFSAARVDGVRAEA